MHGRSGAAPPAPGTAAVLSVCPSAGGLQGAPPFPRVPAGLHSLLSFLLQTLPVSAKRCLPERALTRNSPRWKNGTGTSPEPRCGAAPRRGFLGREPGLSRMEAGSGRQSGLHARPGFCAGFPRDLGQIPWVLPNFSVWERDSLSPASSSRISRGPQRTFEKALGNKALLSPVFSLHVFPGRRRCWKCQNSPCRATWALELSKPARAAAAFHHLARARCRGKAGWSRAPQGMEQGTPGDICSPRRGAQDAGPMAIRAQCCPSARLPARSRAGPSTSSHAPTRLPVPVPSSPGGAPGGPPCILPLSLQMGRPHHGTVPG